MFRRTHFAPLVRQSLIGVIALALAGCSENYEWNQKVTIEIETPDGIRSRSTVNSIKYIYVPKWLRGLSQMANVYHLQGDAIVLEVSPGRYLFALTPMNEYLAQSALHETLGEKLGAIRKMAPRIVEWKGSVTLRPNDYPTLVTFENIDDPRSMRLVNPSDLAASFGAGVALRSFQFEITSDPITVGFARRMVPYFSWSDERRIRYSGNVNPLRAQRPDGRFQSFTESDFSKELKPK